MSSSRVSKPARPRLSKLWAGVREGISVVPPRGARRLITCLPSVETLGLVMLSPSGTGVRLGNKSGSEIIVVAFPALKGWAILRRPCGARRLITCLSSVERLGYLMPSRLAGLGNMGATPAQPPRASLLLSPADAYCATPMRCGQLLQCLSAAAASPARA